MKTFSTPNFLRSRGKEAIIFLIPLLVAVPDIIFNIINKTELKELWGILFTYAILLMPVYFFRNHLKAYFFIPAICILIAPFAIFPILYFGTIPDVNIFMLVYNTSYQEASELLKPYLFQILMIGILDFCILIALYKLTPSKISTRKAAIISTVGFLVLLAIPVMQAGTTNYVSRLKGNLYSYYPFYLGYSGHEFYSDIKSIDRYPANVAHFSFHAAEKDKLRRRQIYVLVIGESSRYDHWGINHYYRNTSPYLSHTQGLISFNKVVAGGSFTEIAVPIIITRATPRDFDIAFRQKSIVSLFKEAGFDTYWITDQTDLGNIIIHAHEANHQIMRLSSYIASRHVHRDMELANIFKRVVAKGERKIFVVIHGLGSHNDYTNRYPQKFDVFKPSGKGTLVQSTNIANKKELINGYDNSILYTDAVLHKVIQTLDSSRCVGAMLYLSDHGENLFDDSRRLILHPPDVITRYTAHVPFFVYTTRAYDSLYEYKVENLRSHVNSKASSSDTFSTLCGLAGITFPGWDSTKSLANKSFIARQRYILAGLNEVFRYSDIRLLVRR